MTETADISVLAIDGGGTRCRFALSDADGLHMVEGGRANVSSDFDGTVATILHGLSDLATHAGRSVENLTVLPAFVGLAGMTGPAIASRLEKALPLRTARYVDDRPAAVRGALGERDGVVAHCGTGSFIAAQIDRHMRLAGGWGPVLGDEGSAQLLGRRLLWIVLQHVDGFHAETPLIKEVLARFGDAANIVRFAGGATPTELGALAPLVTRAAQNGDAAGRFLMAEAAGQVADCLRQLGWKPGLAICLTGGISPYYAPYLPEEMQAYIREPEAEPIQGAVALALAFAQEDMQ